ncbi:SIMPL domain-containing protein [Aeromicrobium sp.]
MTLEITVRGSAEKRIPAERATVSLSAAIEGHEKERVYREAVAIQEPLTRQLAELVDGGAVTTWSSDQVWVYSQRPWGSDGQRLRLTHYADVAVRAEFIDFERLGGFLDNWGGKDGVEIGGVVWDVMAGNRRSYESDVRRSAVDDAVAKAQSYSDALQGARVHAAELADPGMLNPDPGGSAPMLLSRALVDGRSAPQLHLTSRDIVICIEVDAKFTTE